jgi:hypothetical protein
METVMGRCAKKSDFFIKTDWTVCIILTILMGSLSQSYLLGGNQTVTKVVSQKAKSEERVSAAARIADFELRLRMTQKELGILRKEMADVLKQSEKRDQEYLRLQMSIAASIADGSRKEYDKQNRELLKALYGITLSGETLVSNSTEFCNFVEMILDQKSITDIDKARVKLRLGKLKSAAEKFHMRIKPRPEDLLFQSCRVFAVNDTLQVVVVNVGTTSGMRNGLFLRTESGDCTLSVVAVRPFISAAIVTKGDISSLSKGAVLYPGK